MSTFTFQLISQMRTMILSLNPVWFTDIYMKNTLKKVGYEFDNAQVER